MIVKRFKAGETAVSLGDGWVKPYMCCTVAAEVVKVGRKYVTALLNGQEIRFCAPCNCDLYLIEDKDWGAPRLLFPTSEAADRYCEREKLKLWVAEETGWLKMERYSLEQLRAVKQILEHIGDGPLTPCDGYQKFPQKTPLILQPMDWTPGEWATLCQVCGLPADRTAEIKIHASEIECFTAAHGTDVGASAGFLTEPRKCAFSVGGELPDGHNREPLTEPFIWEPEDWTSEEWATLCKLCSLPVERTQRILLRAGEIEYSLSSCDELPDSESDSGQMTEEEVDAFKKLFSCYCQQEINQGYCASDSCEFCTINQAYDRIFSSLADEEDEDGE